MPGRVLVVDDTPLNVKLLTVKLEYEDYVVSTAADGFEALLKIEAEKPDIVLLDVLMPPGIDGFETCRRIRADPATAHIPVVMVTALQDVDDLVRGLRPALTISSPYRSTALRLSLAFVHSYGRNVTTSASSNNRCSIR